jgi:hypothetical protein
VAVLAVSLTRVLGEWAHAAQAVDRLGDRLEVVRVYATGRPAKMIGYQPVRYRPNQRLVRDVVGVPHPGRKPEAPVLLIVEHAGDP